MQLHICEAFNCIYYLAYYYLYLHLLLGIYVYCGEGSHNFMTLVLHYLYLSLYIIRLEEVDLKSNIAKCYVLPDLIVHVLLQTGIKFKIIFSKITLCL